MGMVWGDMFTLKISSSHPDVPSNPKPQPKVCDSFGVYLLVFWPKRMHTLDPAFYRFQQPWTPV